MVDIAISKLLAEALQHHQAGRLPEAEALYRQILARDQRCVDAFHYLGVIALQVGQPGVAAELIGHAAALAPQNPAIHSNLGEAHRRLGRLDDAIAEYRTTLALQPEHPAALNNLAITLAAQGRTKEALACGRRAVAIQPNLASAHNTLGSILRELGRRDEALACFQRAATLDPGCAEAHNNLGLVFQEQGQPEDAVTCFQRTLALRPYFAAAHSNLILALHYGPHPKTTEIEAELRRWNQNHVRPLSTLVRAHTLDRTPERRLRVGYVSADFRLHSIAFFLLPLLEACDRGQLHVTCYSSNPYEDDVTARFRANVDAWQSLVDLSDEDAAERIRADRIDILVDLGGHTAGNRLPIFARKPAPIQVSYLGFPASTGLETMDYRFTDPWADPPDETAGYYSESLVRLPNTAWCFAPLADSPPVSEPPARRLGHVTFGCFNSLAKVSDEMLRLWTRILQRVPNSRLALKNLALGSPTIVQRLQASFGHVGISSDRLELIPPQASVYAHLQCHDRMDLALDTLPYHGTTTTCEALWMGVPVLTLAGKHHVSRVGVSLLNNVDLTEFITDSPDAYVEAAVAAASDLPRLAALRGSLRERMRRSPLMDAPRLARHLEAAYRTMWHRWCAPPAPMAAVDSPR